MFINSKKNKIVYIAQSAGGVAEYLKNLLKYINKDDFEHILILSNDYKRYDDFFKKYFIKVYYVDMVREISISNDIKSIFQIRKIINNEKPNLVYMHSSKAGALGRITLLLNFKIKKIYNPHGWYFDANIGRKKIIFKFIEKILAINTNKIVAISKHEFDIALKSKICKINKLVLIENAIDTSKYIMLDDNRKKTREKYKIKDEDIVVGIVGRISEQKDPISSIKSAVGVIQKNQNIIFMFVGCGELENEIFNISINENIRKNIILTGWVDNVHEYIPAFDIALLPSKWEGFGLAILEYMICKKPIITTGVGGIKNFLKKENGFFVNMESPNEISGHILNIVNNNVNMEKMLDENYEMCKLYYSMDRLVCETERMLRDLIKKEDL